MRMIAAELLNSNSVRHPKSRQPTIRHRRQDHFCHSYIRLLLSIDRFRSLNQKSTNDAAAGPHNYLPADDGVGFGSGLASSCLFDIGEYMVKQFRNRREFKQLTQRADEYITMTIHLAVDQIEDQMELARLRSFYRYAGRVQKNVSTGEWSSGAGGAATRDPVQRSHFRFVLPMVNLEEKLNNRIHNSSLHIWD